MDFPGSLAPPAGGQVGRCQLGELHPSAASMGLGVPCSLFTGRSRFHNPQALCRCLPPSPALLHPLKPAWDAAALSLAGCPGTRAYHTHLSLPRCSLHSPGWGQPKGHLPAALPMPPRLARSAGGYQHPAITMSMAAEVQGAHSHTATWVLAGSRRGGSTRTSGRWWCQ